MKLSLALTCGARRLIAGKVAHNKRMQATRSKQRARDVMRVETKLLLVVSLLLASSMTIAGEESVERCPVPPKVIVENAEGQYIPPSTAMPPVGKVILEFTVTTEGTIRDVLVVEPIDSRLERWAIEESKKLRFEAVDKACRTQFTLESRIVDGSMHNKRIEIARAACPTRKRRGLLLTAQSRR